LIDSFLDKSISDCPVASFLNESQISIFSKHNHPTPQKDVDLQKQVAFKI